MTDTPTPSDQSTTWVQHYLDLVASGFDFERAEREAHVDKIERETMHLFADYFNRKWQEVVTHE